MRRYQKMTIPEIVRTLTHLNTKQEELVKEIDECYAELDWRDQIQNPRVIRTTTRPTMVYVKSRVNPRIVDVYLRGGRTQHTTSLVVYHNGIRTDLGRVEVLYNDEKKADRINAFVDDGRLLEIQSPALYWVTSYKNGFVEVELDQHAYAKAVPHDHAAVQHRDGKEPWCNVCHKTEDGSDPVSKIGIYPPGYKGDLDE